MEAPFRVPIEQFQDLVCLLSALDTCPLLVPGSLRLAEGQDLLAQQLADEGRAEGELLATATGAQGLVALLRALWETPLAVQRPRFLRIEVDVLEKPDLVLSLRVDVPVCDAYPRWVDLEGARDREHIIALLQIYHAVSEQAGLPLLEV